jgi:LytR cell envelope-related transcriptional attenuator
VSADGPTTGQNEDMSQPSGGGGLARGASSAALKGAVLIGLAVIVGVFLLQRVDTSKAGSPTTTTVKRTTTTTTRPAPTTTTSTVPSTPMKTPDQLRVIVLNGGAPTGAAATMRTSLQQVGYTNQPQANTWTGHHQTGNTLMCKPGFDREKVALSQQTPLQGAHVVDFPTPPPPFSSDVDCVVVVGA